MRRPCKFCSWIVPDDGDGWHTQGYCSAGCKEADAFQFQLAKKYSDKLQKVTPLETELYETLKYVRQYFTQGKIMKADYMTIMAKVMQGLKMYENKKYGTAIL